MHYQRGYTLGELLFALSILAVAAASIVLSVAIIGTVIHFINKFW
jgi:prepilin-type N-terminal cleavage/methylation domain-containing protein